MNQHDGVCQKAHSHHRRGWEHGHVLKEHELSEGVFKHGQLEAAWKTSQFETLLTNECGIPRIARRLQRTLPQDESKQLVPNKLIEISGGNCRKQLHHFFLLKIAETNASCQAWGTFVSINTLLHNSTANLQAGDPARQMVFQNSGEDHPDQKPCLLSTSRPQHHLTHGDL